MAGDDTVGISMTWAQWKFIDATIDNTGSVAAVDLDSEVADRTVAIRRIGWAATEHVDKPSMDRAEWPPPEALQSEPVTVAISRDDWQLVLDELDRWSQVGQPNTEMNDVLGSLIEVALATE